MVEVIEKEAADGEIAEVVESGGRRSLPSKLDSQLVIVGMISEWDVRKESVGLVLQIAQHRQVLYTILNGLDVPIEHGAVRTNAEAVCSAMDIDPVLTSEFLVGDRHAHTFAEHLGATAGKCVKSGLAQCDQHIFDRHFVDAGDVRDLDGGKGLDVHVRVSRFQSAKHLAVVCEPRLHVETADDMELLSQPVRLLGFGVDLLERVVISAFFLRQPRKGTEYASLPQITDVGRIDVLIGGEGHDIAVPTAVGVIGKHADPQQIGRREEI